MERQYPDKYEEEQDGRAMTLTVSAYAPPEFMGLIHENRQYRGRNVSTSKEREEIDE